MDSRCNEQEPNLLQQPDLLPYPSSCIPTGVPVTDVKNVIIWGNHSSSQYPDVNHGTVKGKPIRKVIQDDSYLNEEFISTVQQRGAAIIKVCLPPCSMSGHMPSRPAPISSAACGGIKPDVCLSTRSELNSFA